MTDYIPTGRPDDDTRGIAKQIRDEFAVIQKALNTKADLYGTTSVSTTSLTIGTGTKSLTIETGKEFVPSMDAIISDAAAPTINYMVGKILSYNSLTGALQVDVTSAVGSGTKTAWVIGLSNQSGVTLVNNSFSGHQNFARATVASHATGADIWGAAGNQIDFTGTTTVTDFPGAPQAGATRELICSAGCSFTAGANMLIDGVSSGSTVTCAANDVVIVRAISITQFRLTRIRYDGRAQKEIGDNVVTVHTGNGHGSTNTKIRRFTTILANIGTAITYSDSATLGASLTINEDGLYEVFYQDSFETTAYTIIGASLNSTQLTTNIDAINASDRVFSAQIGGNASTGNVNCGSRVLKLSAGNVIRPHTMGAALAATSAAMMSIRKIAYA